MEINDKVKLNEEGRQNECYNNFKDKILIITHKATSKAEHPGYDEGLEGEPLYSFKFEDGADCPNSLYEYEIVLI